VGSSQTFIIYAIQSFEQLAECLKFHYCSEARTEVHSNHEKVGGPKEVQAYDDAMKNNGVILDRVSFHGRFVHIHLPSDAMK